MNHTERRILRNIIIAQVASDGGKDKPWLVNSLPSALREAGMKAYKSGYSAKDVAIRAALSDIARYNPDCIRFFIMKDDPKKAKYIVYFDIRIGEERKQVSFHTSCNLKRWVPGCNRSMGKWTPGAGSRQICLEIANLLCGSER